MRLSRMGFLDGLFGSKYKPLSSAAPNTLRNSNAFVTNNPEVVPTNIQVSLSKFLDAWKRRRIDREQQKVLAKFAQEHPVELKTFVNRRLSEASNTGSIAANDVNLIKGYFDPSVLNQLGGRRSSRRKTRRSRKSRRKTRGRRT
jgi:hypothetical protein